MPMKQYETVFVMLPSLSEREVDECIKGVLAFLSEKGAELVGEEHWGLRKLAYPIGKHTSGHYHVVEFRARPSVIADLEVMYKRNERCIRHLVVVLDRHAIAFNRRKKEAKTEAEQETKTEKV